MKGGRILVVDDNPGMLGLWRRVLEPAHEVTVAPDGETALRLLEETGFDVVVSDVRMPGKDGFAVLEATRARAPGTEVLLVTAFATVDQAVAAIRQGAYDFLTKPFDPDQALLRVERALERRRLRSEAEELRRQALGAFGFGELVGQSVAAGRFFHLLRRAAATDLTVLLTGESGTGKELAARALHLHGPRADGPFVAVNCGALPAELMESELFGHLRGSFSGASQDKRGLFEAANGGTLFLDEVSELPLPLQVKLNRALQEREIRRVGDTVDRKVDVRVVAATNVDLQVRVGEGRFREDLYFRLAVFPVRVPPLRERREDIPLLTQALLERHRARTASSTPREVDPEAMAALRAYPWPGNVRELENVLLRAAALSEGGTLRLADLPPELTRAPSLPAPDADILSRSFRETLQLAQDEAARRYLTALLQAHGGSVTRAAEAADMARETLHRALRRYGIEPDHFRT